MEERFPENAGQQTPPRAVRLIFEYEGDQVKLVSQQPVDMEIFAIDSTPDEHSPYYIDTRNASGESLARVNAPGAFLTSAEVFPEQPGEPITRVALPKQRGAFTVIAPAPDDSDHVAIIKVSIPLADGDRDALSASAVMEEIGRFPISVPGKEKQEGGEQ